MRWSCSAINYRLTDIACALGISQLKKLEQIFRAGVKLRSDMQLRSGELAGSHAACGSCRSKSSLASVSHPHRSERLTAGRAQIFRALRAENIGVNVHYIPVHCHPYYRNRFGYRGGEYPMAENAYERLISLPMFHGMSDQDVEDVIAAVSKVLHYYAR